MKNTLIQIALFIIFSTSVYSQNLTWVQHPSNGNEYALTSEPLTWSNAESLAQSVGGHLVTINDIDENNWVLSTFGNQWLSLESDNNDYVWTGFHDNDLDNVFEWSSGENNTFTNWRNGEPNKLSGADGTESIAAINGVRNGQWDDIVSGVNIYGIIEKPSQNDGNINTVENFPDSNFRQAIEEFMGVATNGTFTIEQAASKTGTFDGSKKGIESVKGIEYFVNLKELILFENNLTSIDVSRLKQLTKLELGKNNLSKIDVSELTNLTHLHLYSNNLTVIDISNLLNITFLDVWSNQLTDLDVSHLSQLDYLIAGNNNLEHIDVSNNQQLFWLDLEYTNISSLEVSNNPNLNGLKITGNNISSLDLSNNKEIRRLYVGENNLDDISFILPLDKLDILDVRQNLLSCDDWDNIQHYSNLLGTFNDSGANPSGFAYTPQKGIDSFNCNDNLNQRRYFRDNALRVAVEEFMDVEPNAPFTAFDALQKTGTLDLSGLGIQSIEGVSSDGILFFKNIESLILNNNDLTDISILLDGEWIQPGKTLDVRNNYLGNNLLLELEKYQNILADQFLYLPQKRGNSLLNLAYNPSNQHYYAVFNNFIDWNEAIEFTATFFESPGYLATITTQEENDFIVENLGWDNLRRCWLGGFQDQDIDESNPENRALGWNWVTGESWEYTNWDIGEPDHFNGTNQDYLSFKDGNPGKWSDHLLLEDTTRGLVVEWDTSPIDNFVVINPEQLPDTPTIGGNTITTPIAELIKIDIPVRNLPDTYSFSFNLLYDSSLLTFNSISKENSLIQSFSFVDANEIEPGIVIVAALGNEPISGDGNLVSVFFDLNQDIQNGTSLQIEITDIVGIDGVIAEPINIQIQNLRLGDLNQDETVNIIDVQILFNAVLGKIELSQDQMSVSDLNNDGNINILDVQRLFNAVLGKIDLNVKQELTNSSVYPSQMNSISIESISSSVNETVNISVSVSGNETLSAIEGTISYDSDKLEFIRLESNSTLTETFDFIEGFEPTRGNINFAGISSSGIQSEGALFNLQFRVKDTSTGIATIQISRIDGDLVDFQIQNGGITVTDSTEIENWKDF